MPKQKISAAHATAPPPLPATHLGLGDERVDHGLVEGIERLGPVELVGARRALVLVEDRVVAHDGRRRHVTLDCREAGAGGGLGGEAGCHTGEESGHCLLGVWGGKQSVVTARIRGSAGLVGQVASSRSELVRVRDVGCDDGLARQNHSAGPKDLDGRPRSWALRSAFSRHEQ